MKNAETVGATLMAASQGLAKRHKHITAVRGRGLMMGIELDDPALVKRVVLGAFKKGVLLLGAGKSTIRFAPPLVIDDEDVRIATSMVDEMLSD
jgi:4-aminobutyrate aminotransferase